MLRGSLYLIALIFGALLLAVIIGIFTRESLDPPVANILEHSLDIDEQAMQQNAYVSFMGIHAPEDTDYFLLGKQIILNNQQTIKAAIASNDFKPRHSGYQRKYYNQNRELQLDYGLSEKDYQFPCRYLTDHNCTQKIIEQTNDIVQLAEKNHILLERYKQIVKLPNYDGYYTSLKAPTLNYGNMMRLADLRLAEASLLIYENQLSEGFQILQEEVDFYKNILSGQDSLIGPMIAIRQLLTIYHVIGELLDKPELASYITDNKLEQLLAPLTTQQQQAIARSLAIERNSIFYFHFSLSNEERNELGFFYDQNATANKTYKKFEKAIEQALLTLPEITAEDLQVIAEPAPEIDNIISLLGYLIKEKGIYFLHNLTGEILINVGASNHYHNYQYRLYDLVSYLTLINTKLAIKQANIEKQQIASWLKKQNIVNPYTQQPIIWDERQQLLITEWLDDTKVKYGNDKRDGERPAVFISF